MARCSRNKKLWTRHTKLPYGLFRNSLQVRRGEREKKKKGPQSCRSYSLSSSEWINNFMIEMIKQRLTHARENNKSWAQQHTKVRKHGPYGCESFIRAVSGVYNTMAGAYISIFFPFFSLSFVVYTFFFSLWLLFFGEKTNDARAKIYRATFPLLFFFNPLFSTGFDSTFFENIHHKGER